MDVMTESTELKAGKNEVLIGEDVLTRYERARIIGARALQLSQGAPVLIEVDDTNFRHIDLAKSELKARVLPIGLARKLPSRHFQIIPIQYLKDREFINQEDF